MISICHFRCHNGYKGDRCNKLDGVAVDLRTLLATISIVLSLLILCVIVITFLYVKKVEAEDNQKLLKNEQIIPMDDLNNNYNYYDNKIDIRNMPKHSVQQDIILEETSDAENITDF